MTTDAPAAEAPALPEGVLDECPQPEEWVARRIARAMLARKQARPSDTYIMGRQDWPEERRFQLQFHRSNHIVRAMFPGNGAGKTTVAGVECDYWLQHSHPFCAIPAGRVIVLWICQKYQQMDILREQLEGQCLTAGWSWSGTHHCYTWPAGDKLYVISNDADWTAIQGINPDLVVIDEECDEALWRELQMRRRGRKKTRFVISATATKGKRWMFHGVYAPWVKHHEDLGLTEDRAIEEQQHPTTWVWPRGGIEDNPGADAQDLEWYTNGVQIRNQAERTVRLSGGFMDLNASPVLNLDAIDLIDRRRKAEGVLGIQGVLVTPKKRRFPHRIAEFEFLPGPEYEGGRITIFEQPDPNDVYVLGADFGYGLANRDFDAAVVLSQKHRRQVAEAVGRWGDVHMAYVLWSLAWYYNEALIVGEQQVGLPVMRRLYDEWGYRYFYTEKDDREKSPRPSNDLGHFRRHGDLIIPRLQWAIAPQEEKTGRILNPAFWWRSPELIDQFKRYEFKPKSDRMEMSETSYKDLTMGAASGYHDDLLMAAAYAVTGWIDLPKFIKPKVELPMGSIGHALKHEDILSKQAPRPSAFKFARRK